MFEERDNKCLDNDADPAPMPLSELAHQIRVSLKCAKDHYEAFHHETIKLTQLMGQARKQFTADRDFGRWLEDNALDHINKDDRAALINMPRYPEKTKSVLAKTRSFCWQLIWRKEIEPWVLNNKKPDDKSTTRTRRSPFNATPEDQALKQCFEQITKVAKPFAKLSEQAQQDNRSPLLRAFLKALRIAPCDVDHLLDLTGRTLQ